MSRGRGHAAPARHQSTYFRSICIRPREAAPWTASPPLATQQGAPWRGPRQAPHWGLHGAEKKKKMPWLPWRPRRRLSRDSRGPPGDSRDPRGNSSPPVSDSPGTEEARTTVATPRSRARRRLSTDSRHPPATVGPPSPPRTPRRTKPKPTKLPTKLPTVKNPQPTESPTKLPAKLQHVKPS